MFRVFAALLLFLLQPPAEGPTYAVFTSAPRISDDDVSIVVEFSVFNASDEAGEQPVTAELRILGDATVIATTTLPPIGPNATQFETFTVPVSQFPADSIQPLEISVTSDEIAEPVTTRTSITIPPWQPGAAPPASAPAANSPVAGIIETVNALLPFDLSTASSSQIAVLVGGVAVLLLLLWLLILIPRLLFQRKPVFGAQPPPYANTPQLDPNSREGRRQMWQHVAQNGSVLAEKTDGALHARKLLLGTNGQPFDGWSLRAVRVSQYDTYGRVARTQVLAPAKFVRQLNRLATKQLPPPKLQRRLKPVAVWLAKRIGKLVNKRNAMLPVALDVRFQGEHGEVSILFELYQVRGGNWAKLDHWEPEMTVIGKAIHESYTFTVHGQMAEEPLRAYRKRLREDLTDLLTEMLLCTAPAAQLQRPHALPTENNVRPVAAPDDTDMDTSMDTVARMRRIDPQ